MLIIDFNSNLTVLSVWEISTGRCLRSFDVEAAVKWVAWNPSSKLFLLAIVIENKVIFLNPETYLMDKIVVQQTNAVFREEPEQGDYIREFCVMNPVFKS